MDFKYVDMRKSDKTESEVMIKDYLKSETASAIKFEKIHTEIFPNSNVASQMAAKEIAETIRRKQKELKPCVLGLATGSTPKKLYQELIRLHREEGLSFKNVLNNI